MMEGRELLTSYDEAVARGMALAWHAARCPDGAALVSPHGDRTFAELNAAANQLSRLLARHGIALDWVAEEVKGWQAYRPKNEEALIARPMTVATIAWALLRLYMPRDTMARAIASWPSSR